MAFPYTTHNCLRIYDRMVALWIGSLPVDYGNIAGRMQNPRGMLTVYASPTKALAAMSNVLRRKGWIKPGDIGSDNMDYDDWITVPLPFASIQRQDPTWDAERANVPFVYRKFLREGNAYRSTRFPLPFDITYNVDFWMRRKFTDAHIREWLMVQHSPIGAANNELFLTAEFGEPWGNKIIPVTDLSYTDNSDLEPDEDSDRNLRFTLNFTLKAWVFPPPSTARPTVLRVITDVGPMSLQNPNEFQSTYDRIIGDPDDSVEQLLEEDPILFETSDDVVQDGNTFTVPEGGYIQTVDVPLYRDEAAYVEANLELNPSLPDGILFEVRDYNENLIQSFRLAEALTEGRAAFLTIPGADVGSIRVRLDLSDATELTVNDFKVRTVTLDLAESENLLPAGDMESGSPADWTPDPGSSTLVPALIEFDTAVHYEGTQSLHVDTVSQNQGMERTLTVPSGKLFLVELRLYGTGGDVELSLLDGVDPSYANESRAVIQLTEDWSRYALVVRSGIDGKISMRVRQRGPAGSTFYVDAVRLYQVVVRNEPEMAGLYT